MEDQVLITPLGQRSTELVTQNHDVIMAREAFLLALVIANQNNCEVEE